MARPDLADHFVRAYARFAGPRPEYAGVALWCVNCTGMIPVCASTAVVHNPAEEVQMARRERRKFSDEYKAEVVRRRPHCNPMGLHSYSKWAP
jgi:hypothetical protein